jgi:demethylmenaquinone methyltransferase/2-methoxy-6-polyprenyl-1,4-benzoquinol methylase
VDRSSPRRPAHHTAARFASIARRYDLTNTVLSGGLHHRWKQQAVAAALLRPGDRVLDAGTGTGDLARLAVKAGAAVVGVDVSLEMLAVAQRRLNRPRVAWAGADVAQLPFRAATFDVVLTGFTLRHPTSLEDTLKELGRVLVPSGRLIILEFARPVQPLVHAVYRAYSGLIPTIGGWLTGDADAYAYLVESIRRFPGQALLAGKLSEAGFERIAYRNLTGGIVAIHSAVRPR